MPAGRAINGRMRSGGIVGDHAADGRPRAGGHVRPEPEAMRSKEVVKLIKDDAGADANGEALRIEVADGAIVSSEIDDQPVADRPANEPASSPARGNRYTGVSRRPNDRRR